MEQFTEESYYNSISRQSGIVHKDKAMRQLDLDLLQWLMVAGSASPAIKNKLMSEMR